MEPGKPIQLRVIDAAGRYLSPGLADMHPFSPEECTIGIREMIRQLESMLLAITGHDFAPELMTIGERISNQERMILAREGVGRQDDALPPRMREPVPNE